MKEEKQMCPDCKWEGLLSEAEIKVKGEYEYRCPECGAYTIYPTNRVHPIFEKIFKGFGFPGS